MTAPEERPPVGAPPGVSPPQEGPPAAAPPPEGSPPAEPSPEGSHPREPGPEGPPPREEPPQETPPSPGPSQERRVVSVLGHPVAGLAPISLLSAGWILLALQVVPWIRDRFAEAVLDGLRPGIEDIWPAPPPVILAAVISLGFLVVGTVLFLIWVRSAGGFGPLSDRLLRRKESLAGIVLLAAGVLTISILARGVPCLGETKAHVARAWLWFDDLRAGTLPRWTDLWFGGFPVDQHYPPLAHILQAALQFTRLDPYGASKLLVWFCRIAGGVGFALFAARAHRDTRSGFLGGLIYAVAPVFHGIWIWQGWIPGSVFFAVLPWGFLAAERLSTGTGGVRAGAALGLVIGGLALAQTSPARLALILLGSFSVLRAVPTMATRGARTPSVFGLAIGWIGGGLLAATFVYPIVRESATAAGFLTQGFGRVTLHVPGIEAILATLRWTPEGKEYLGVTVAVLAIGGLAVSIRDRLAKGTAIGPIPLAVLVVLPWFLAPANGRWFGMTFFGGILAAAGAVRRIETRSRRFGHSIVFPLAILLVTCDLAPFSLITTYAVHREGHDRIYEILHERMPEGRFLELPADPHGKPLPSMWHYAAASPVASVGGPIVEEAPTSYAFMAATIDTVAHRMRGKGRLPPDLVRLLALDDIHYVLVTTPRGPALPAGLEGPGFVVDPSIPAYRVEAATPVWILEPGTPPGPVVPPQIEVGTDGLAPDLARQLARGELAWLRAASPKPVDGARSVVLPNRLQIDIPDIGASTIRIARNASERTQLLVDGQPWSWRPGPLGGIACDLRAGAHRIEVWGTEDRVRRICRYIQWALAGLLFLVSIGPPRR